jgi:Ser/Thr protein kinase RdoA (MazF antagonist)
VVIDVGPWDGLVLGEPLGQGSRNSVWAGLIGGARVAVRRSRRSTLSLAWELDLLAFLADTGFRVPSVVRSSDGHSSVGGVVVQQWLDGRRPSSASDWRLVADQLGRLHNLTAGYHQRPDCATVTDLAEHRRSVDADLDAIPADVAGRLVQVFAAFADVPVAVVHGDPGPDNLRIGPDGSAGLLDWDESRVDAIWHDLSNLGLQVLNDDDHRRAQRLSNAWETANAWTLEPEYALDRLRLLDDH